MTLPLLPDAAFAGMRRSLERVLVHRCTLTPVIPGAVDSENNAPATPGSPALDVPCIFDATVRAVRDEGGATIVSGPTLTVSATLVISIGDQVSVVTDQLGGTPPGAAGTFRVEHVYDATAGLGAALLPSYILKGAGAV